jgi:homoserine trans-succinylase
VCLNRFEVVPFCAKTRSIRRHIYVILELAAMGDLRDHMLAMTERRAVDLLVRPLLTALNLMLCKVQKLILLAHLRIS